VNTVDALVAMQPTQGDGTIVATPVIAVPTEAPTLVPTATATEIAATEVPAEPTAAPTTAAAAIDPSLAENDPRSIFVGMANPASGAELFKGTYDTEEGVPWSCNTCHNVDNPTVKIGPSLLGVGTRAYSRVPGMGPYSYLFDSIRKPQDYIVPDFENGQQMPHFLPTSLTDPMVYDIIAYLMTLE
jgi:cytochrome c2